MIFAPDAVVAWDLTIASAACSDCHEKLPKNHPFATTIKEIAQRVGHFLLHNSNHAHRNLPLFSLREFQTRLLRCCFRLERFR